MRWLLACLIITSSLAGCASTDLEANVPDSVILYTVSGKVTTPAFNPIQGVIVSASIGTIVDSSGAVVPANETVTPQYINFDNASTDNDGFFTVTNVPAGDLLFHFAHEDFGAQRIRSMVPAPANLSVVMAPLNVVQPYVEDFPFDGYIQCGLEALIITPSCDSAVTVTPAEQVFEDDSIFDIPLSADWYTVIVDIYFDGSSHPGMAGLRASVYEPDSAVALTDYPRITQDWSADPFTIRVEPGTDYGDEIMSPDGAGGLLFRFFPHGHFSEESPALGVGQTTALEFEVIATVFYHEAAPEGWSLLPS